MVDVHVELGVAGSDLAGLNAEQFLVEVAWQANATLVSERSRARVLGPVQRYASRLHKTVRH